MTDLDLKIPAYVYFVTHIPSGKFYYGARYKHVANKRLPEDDLWKYYFTSSKKIKHLRKLDGNESFEYQIIFTSSDFDECFRYEQEIIKENINNPLCLNARYFDIEKSEKVFGVFGKTLSTKGKPKSYITRQRMRKPKSLEHRQNISRSQLSNGGNGPDKHTEETKNKIRETLRLKPRPKKVCPHCGKEGGFIAMSRWHFDNCREKK